MQGLDSNGWILVGAGGLVMALVMLRGIGQGALAVASVLVDERRAQEAREKADNAAIEAAGKAAGLEPLALNPDGTIEEPIIAEVEGKV